MKIAIQLTAVLLLAFTGFVSAQTVTIDRWQDMGPLLDRQSKKINEHTAQVAVMREEINTLKSDMGLVIQRYDMLLRAIIVQVCASNKLITDNSWATTLTGLKPIALPGHTCPTDPMTAKYYVPQYLSPSGPPIPAQ